MGMCFTVPFTPSLPQRTEMPVSIATPSQNLPPDAKGLSCAMRGYCGREQKVGIVLDHWDILIQTLDDGTGNKLVDRIPTWGGGVILHGRAASAHSPDCAPLWGKTRCTSSCSMARVSLQALKPKALSRAYDTGCIPCLAKG